jgi:hypothetical protein
MTIPGALAEAERFGAEHLAGGVDTWLITAHLPVTVSAMRAMQMRTQFVLTLVRLDDLPDGGYPRQMDSTHEIAMAPIVREFKSSWLDDGVRPAVQGDSVMLHAPFGASGDRTARDVSRAIAGGFASGEMPLQGRHLGWAFYRGVRMVALALGQGAETEHVIHPADSTR